MTRKELATKYFSQGFNCSQSVFAVFSEKYGLSKELALKIGADYAFDPFAPDFAEQVKKFIQENCGGNLCFLFEPL